MEETMKDTTLYAETKENKSNTKLSFFDFLLFVFMMAYYLMPSINETLPFVLVLTLSIAYTSILCLINTKETPYYLTVLVLAAILSVLYFLLTDSATISTGTSSYALKRILSKMNQLYMSFFPLIIFLRIQRYASEGQKKMLLFIALAMFFFVLINTVIELRDNENATRSWDEFTEQAENNVGTYAYVYAVPIVMSLIPALFIRLKAWWQRLILIAVTVFLVMFLLLAQYTLALLISMVGVVLQIDANIEKPTTKVIIWLVLVLLLISMPTLLDFMASKVPSKQMALRLKDVAAFFGRGDISGYNLAERLKLYWKTIEAFFKSPLIGNRSLGFDGHSTFLSFFADLGLLGGIPYVVLYAQSKKNIDSRFDKAEVKIFVPVFISLILMGLTNPIHTAQPLSFAVWLLIPLLINMTTKKEKNNEASLGN